MNVSIDNKNYRLSENHVLHITDYHILKDISISDDIEAYLVIIEREFFGEIMRFSRRVPESVIAAIHDRPIQSINSEDKLRLKNAVEKIIDSIDRKDSPWQADLIKNDLRGFMIEMSIVTYKAYKEHESDIPSGKNTLFFLFLQLLKTHCREQHEVKFYASEIGIDPGYLSRILKKISGKTTAQWISEAIVREAELLLSLPENNVQSVSDELNFSDQSSFGKFFKKHKGISPLKFQQEKIIHG
jgi:AraC-like DNA-binding protein